MLQHMFWSALDAIHHPAVPGMHRGHHLDIGVERGVLQTGVGVAQRGDVNTGLESGLQQGDFGWVAHPSIRPDHFRGVTQDGDLQQC